jgi:hypothetical protein
LQPPKAGGDGPKGPPPLFHFNGSVPAIEMLEKNKTETME